MTLQDYITDVSIKVPTAVTLPQASLILAINDARSELALTCGIGLTIQQVVLVAGTSAYPYITSTTLTQTGVKRIWVYLGTQRYEIGRKPMGEYALEGFQAYPAYFYLQNQSIYFYPIPPSNLTTDWEIVSVPTPLVNITDVELYIPPVYQLAAKTLASSYVALIDNKIKLSEVFRGAYTNLVASFTKGDI